MAKSKKTKVMVNTRPKTARRRTKAREVEVGLLGQALRSLGGLGGSALGNIVGQADVGKSVGSSLGATISRWLGAGDYVVSTNSITSRVANGSAAIPMMHSTSNSVVIRHKEFLTEVKGKTGFSVQGTYVLNPGQEVTFPWLADIASRFSEYKIRGLVFHYVPSSGSAVSSSNPAIGTVMLQTTYRSSESAPTSKLEMLNEFFASESAPNEAFCHPIECNPKSNPFATQYIRTGSVPVGDSPLMYDLGKTFIAVSGMPADNNVVGDLWVTYEVELLKPQLVSNATSIVRAAYFNTRTGFSAGNMFNSVSPFAGNMAATSDSANKITLPIGTIGSYQLLLGVRTSSASSPATLDMGSTPFLTNANFSGIYPASTMTYDRTTTVGATTVGTAFYLLSITIIDPQVVTTIQYPTGSWTNVTVAETYLNITSLA